MKKGKELAMDKLREYLDKNNIHPSYHRLRTLKYLMEHKTHPTVDMIYKDLSKEIATLSRTTIYNTLNLFLKKGIVSGLTIEENEARYDCNTKPHAHFKCVKCGCVYDIDLKCPLFDKKMIEGHKITEHHIYLKGICKKCLKNA
ncbi:MAG: transcriptional repressor [candidate division WOR-3 bacterium]|nr:transcriptional repressor [candidate division WOR-3 bacterium]